MPGNWIDGLLDILCRIYRAWFGDCSEFLNNPNRAVLTVVAALENDGVPTFATPLDKQKFLDSLSELELHLKSPENSLSAADNVALAGFIATLRAALG